jgi:uncharacterized protein (DUF1697 family)
MATWILLLRGINVVGRNRLPMAELVRDLETLRLTKVTTYIQSGNAVFQSSAKLATTLAGRIAARIEERHGFRPHVLILSVSDLARAVESNPFRSAQADPQSLHLFFLDSKPAKPDLASLARIRSTTEQFHLTDRVFYLHAPDGIGKSKLAHRVERFLGVAATARNWRTAQRLLEMAQASSRAKFG